MANSRVLFVLLTSSSARKNIHVFIILDVAVFMFETGVCVHTHAWLKYKNHSASWRENCSGFKL